MIDLDRDIALDWRIQEDGHKATVAQVILLHQGEELAAASGTALCVPEDQYNQGVGVALAMGRALRDLGKGLTREAMRLTRERAEA